MISESAIPPLLTRGDVADLLHVELKSLTWWVWALDEDRRYTEFDIERRNGDPRCISAPIKPLKDIQRRLAGLLGHWYVSPTHVHGFVVGRDPSSNALPHRRQQWVLKLDLADFFPSIHFGRVRGLFMSFPFDFPEDVATLLAQICCHKNQLPQGAPTSPVLSNFICRGMDRDLAKLARAERCYFTRYADDLTFSTNRRVFPGDLAYSEGGQAFAGQALTAIVKHAGFMINERKTRLLRYTQRQRVTGLVVNRQLNIPRDYVRSLRNLLYVGNRYGLAAAENAFSKTAPHPNWPPGKRPAPFLEAVRGRVQYVGSIKGWGDPVYKSLARSLAQLDPSFQYPVLDQPPTSPTTRWRFYVCTEGETDVKHLVAALSHYHQHGNFIDLALEFDNRSSFRGHSELQKHLRHLPASKPSVPTVCLFDRDAEAVLREEGLRQADYSDRGNGVVAAALVTPDFRAEDKRVCIEMLYRDEDLAIKDADGRRVYLRSEFDNRTNQHKTEQCNLGEPKKDTLIRDDVYEFGTGRSLALSKMRFAQSIEQHQPPFDRVSFEGFEPTLRMLQKAAREVANKIL